MNDRDLNIYALLGRSQQLAEEIVEYSQDRISSGQPSTPEQLTVVKGALAIAFTTLSKATGTSIHECIDLVMTIYKNTQVLED